MSEKPFMNLGDVIGDPAFPRVDVALRQGTHIDIHDLEDYAFLRDALAHLEDFYHRYGYELVRAPDETYFYLKPRKEWLGRKQLSRAEMLVGQALALMLLDPAITRDAGVVQVGQVLELLGSLVGQERLIRCLNPRRRASSDARVAEEAVRKEVGKAIRELARLGFVRRLDGDRIRLRESLMRFAEAVRTLADPVAALRELAAQGKVTLAEPSAEVVGSEEEGA